MKNDYFIHPNALVDTQNIGNRSKIWEFTHILSEVKIGENVNINSHCFVESNVIIGNNVTIKCGVYIWDGTIIEDNVFIGPNVTFTNDKYPRSKKNDFENKKITLRKGCSIGAGTTILPGITVGAFAMTGAASLITKDVLPHQLVYGNPAKPHGFICQCGKKWDTQESIQNSTCSECQG